MVLILLPGMDGTGRLFSRLLPLLPDWLATSVIAYPNDRKLDIEDLATYVCEQLYNHCDYVLLAESFSGPVAFAIAQRAPRNLKKIIFIASFISSPRPFLLKLLWLLPLSLLFSIPAPRFFLRWFFFGKQADNALLDLFRQTMKKVSPRVLAFRLRQLACLSLPDRAINLSATYIQAQQDKLVPACHATLIQSRVSPCERAVIAGPHFLLQTKPAECAVEIIKSVQQQMRCAGVLFTLPSPIH